MPARGPSEGPRRGTAAGTSAGGASGFALSILVPTRDRPESLERTVRDLALPSPDPTVEVVVVDNANPPSVDAEALRRSTSLALRVIHEPEGGKGPALNRAISEGGLAPLVAVLDDDMSPEPGWCAAVRHSADSRPRFDVFAGRSYVVWPEEEARPPWAGHPLAIGLQFSVVDQGEAEREMGAGTLGFPSGNHFWFRRSVLEVAAPFGDGWAPEVEFVLRARAAGCRGVFVPSVRCGHRIQTHLFDDGVFVRRAGDFGALLGRVERIGVRARPRSRGRALAAAVRGFAKATAWGLAALPVLALPRRSRIPRRAKANLARRRNLERARRAWRELVGVDDRRGASTGAARPHP